MFNWERIYKYLDELKTHFSLYLVPTMQTTITIRSTTESTPMASTVTTYQPPVKFCNNKKIGNYPDPMRCDGFIACVHGRAIFMKCPAKLRYNPILGQCDWKYNVECSKCKYLIF